VTAITQKVWVTEVKLIHRQMRDNVRFTSPENERYYKFYQIITAVFIQICHLHDGHLRDIQLSRR